MRIEPAEDAAGQSRGTAKAQAAAGPQWLKAVVILIVGFGWFPVTAAAQAVWYLSPSFAIGKVYEDNVFESAVNPLDDYLWRFNPALQAGYRSTTLSLDGFYTFDVERYLFNPQLDSNQASKNAALSLKYAASPRLDLSMDGDYAKTNTPNELAVAAGLQLGRAAASVYSLQPMVSYRFTPITSGTVRYSYTRETLEPGIDSDIRSATLTLNHSLDERNSANLDLEGSDYTFSQGSTGASHALTAGWMHEFTPQTSLSLQVGPRVTDGTYSTDVLVSLSQTNEHGEWSLAYTKTLGTILGLPGPVDQRVATATLVYWPTKSLRLEMLPAFSSYRGTGQHIALYELQLRASYSLSQAVSLVGWYQADVQHGVLNGPSDQRIRRHVTFVGLVVSWGTTPLPQLPPPPSPFSGLLPTPPPTGAGTGSGG
ncbi:MAG: hypothetical protein ACRESX_09730 [Gammaproteobacteria bacterium]